MDDLLSQFHGTVKQALDVSDELEKSLTHKYKGNNAGGRHGKVIYSQPPWASPIAGCITDLHAQARDIENELQIHLRLPVRLRGGSSANTKAALENAVKLAATAEPRETARHDRWLRGWIHRAGVALGETEQIRRLPRLKGEPEKPCPWCERRTLRMLALEGIIRCINPACSDEAGQRPKAEYVWSEVADDMVLRWQDGICGTP